MAWVLYEAALHGPTCILLARSMVRQAAALLGMETGGQARLALAVALAARAALETDHHATTAVNAPTPEQGLPHTSALNLTLRIERATPPLLVAELSVDALVAPLPWVSIATDEAVQQLVNRCELLERDQPAIRFGRTLPAAAQAMTSEDVALLRSQLSAGPESACPGRELGDSDRDLMTAFIENDRVNAEVEDTNRGVVALYAELDDRAEQLRQASELKSRFLSNMSHEFRTPLNSILALARMLLDRTDGELTDEQDRQVGYIRRSAESLTELVNDLLDLAKVEAGKLDLRPQSFTVAALLGGLRGVMKPLQQSDAVELVFDEATGWMPLFTDEAKLAQILRNLVSNALKFTERGEVRVGASLSVGDGPTETRTCVFTVRDTGVGIAPENQEFVFQEFSQVANRLQGRAKGTGLGLPLSRRLAELLGGTLMLESQPGVGSVFTLSIPAILPGAEQDASAAIVAVPTAGGVLLIDDEETSRYVLRQILSSLPAARVLEAVSGVDGLSQAVQHRPDVIVLDLQMPGLNGFDVLERLSANEGTKAIPVVICTSSVLDSDDRARLRRARAILPKAELSRDIVVATITPYLPVT